MPFKNFLSDIKSQVKDLQKQGQQFLGQQQQQQSAPPSQSQSQPHYQHQQQPPHQHQQQQYPAQQYQQSPPLPPSTHPNFQAQGGPPGQQPLPGQPKVYWQPRFDPATPISQEWEHKLGNNNGWGNNEMQHYTAEASNSFYTPNNLLVLRAISSPSHPDPTKKYTSARLVSRQRLGRPSGSLVASLSLPCAGGIWPAFWLLPYEPFTWPTDGEVDIAETWNGDSINHTCLHWGFYSPEDKAKHRVVGTPVQGMQTGRPVRFEFAWHQDRMVWWIDGQAVMKAPVPHDMNRPLSDFVVLLNIAMGGNVCQGQVPREGMYDFVVHEMKMLEEPEGGWARFERDWAWVREGDMI